MLIWIPSPKLIIKRLWQNNLLPLKLVLVLLWLAVTGGYAGWEIPGFLLGNLAFLLTLGVLRLASMRHIRPDAIETALLLFCGAMVISTVTTGAWYGFVRVVIWLGYLAVYRLAKKWPDAVIRRAALGALVPYLLISVFPWENQNIVAFNLIGLALLAHEPYLALAAVLVTAGLQSLGGLVAAAIGALFSRKQPAPIVAMGAVGMAGWWISPGSYDWRLSFWADAWRGFLSSPLVGIGPGQFYILTGGGWLHAHNIFATAAAEMGIIGLAALGWLAWVIARRWYTLPTWAAALVAAYAAWSMIDEPLQIWGSGFIFFIALSRMKGGETYDQSSNRHDEDR